MLYRITLAVDVEAASVDDAISTARKAVSDARQRASVAEHSSVTRCEVTEATKL